MRKASSVIRIGAVLLFSVAGAPYDFARSAQVGSIVASERQPAVAAPIIVAQSADAPGPPQGADERQAPQDASTQDPTAVARINAQIESLMQQPRGGFAVTYYAKPARQPELPSQYSGLAAGPNSGAQRSSQPGQVSRDRDGNPEKYVIARAGDTVYATLDRAFNSDDPQAPIFASIHDVDESGIQGPLDGVRMVGSIKYSSSQASILFEKGYLPDGRPIGIKGLAISEDNARTGFAKNVDTHDFERYSSLLFATLVQGAGQVGQTLLQGNQQATVDPTTGLLVAQQRVSPYQAALGALLPTGQALTAVAAQNFNKPATISAPAGFGLGIVFLDPVVVPRDVLFARNR